MPQMMPMNWLMMFFLLNTIMFLFSILIFNTTSINPPTPMYNNKLFKMMYKKWMW